MDLSEPRFIDPDQARQWLEAQRWPNGPTCPHCGNADRQKITALHGKAHRPGVYQCNELECREQFTVTVGTVMERSKIALHKWVMAMHLLSSSKKGMSSHQLHRMLGITYQSAWFLTHRIREAMREDGLAPMGGGGKVVEADETYFGQVENPTPSRKRKGRPFTKGGKSGPAGKRAVVALVERGGRVRAFNPAVADGDSVNKIVRDNIARESRLHTDESRLYITVGKEFSAHETVTHSHGEYVRYEDDRTIHTNTIEGYFSIFKRGMRGVYQHCAEKHLHRYLAEFDFRYNRRTALGVTDTERAEDVARGAEGKRLTYEISNKERFLLRR
jgi:transposase-like protein